MATLTSKIKRVDGQSWELPIGSKTGMRVPGLVFASAALMEQIKEDRSLDQVANVATLPGIVGHSMAMPDIHWGYGFPIGGVAAMRTDTGVISPGGVGFDINCGVRLIRTNLTEADVRPKLEKMVSWLYRDVPSGVGSTGIVNVTDRRQFDNILVRGAEWSVESGYGVAEDLAVTEEGGRMEGADPSAVGERPRKRGAGQIGTLGSGNHFLEIQVVDEIFDAAACDAMGVEQPGQVLIMFHCGSRGLGHQVCQDHVEIALRAMSGYGISVPDRQLACMPIGSQEGMDYLSAMRCAANYAWANRQMILHQVRMVFEHAFELSWRELGMHQVYDVSHNMAKIETHTVDGKALEVCVHRKGATRSFPAGHPDLPAAYRKIGQPVLIPGDMGRSSYLCVGGRRAMERSFGSACHGAGRLKSRHAAKNSLRGRDIREELLGQGIVAMSKGWASLAEEAPEVYKNVEEVVGVCHEAGLATRAARLRPMGVIKG